MAQNLNFKEYRLVDKLSIDSVLARHYTDYSPERLKAIYDKAELKVLG
jgi:hypothetical protein